MKQVYYQGNLLSERRPVEVLLWRQDTPAQLKEKLQILKRILAYAKKKGLNVGGAYSYYVQLDQDAVSYLVQAAPPDELALKTWRFPIVGEVSYLGFYHKRDRDRFAQELARESYEISLGEAEAFSSLGWFDDPIFSTMLDRNEADLAHLIFHELTHRTLWIPGEVEFNENFAEFVGITLARQYLTESGKKGMLADLERKLSDKIKFAAWLKALRAELDALYREHAGKIAMPQLLQKRAALFKKFTTKRFPAFALPGYRGLAKKEWNNAVVLGYSLYQPDFAVFERGLRCTRSDDVVFFLKKLEAALEKEDDPRKALDRLCHESRLHSQT